MPALILLKSFKAFQTLHSIANLLIRTLYTGDVFIFVAPHYNNQPNIMSADSSLYTQLHTVGLIYVARFPFTIVNRSKTTNSRTDGDLFKGFPLIR